MYATFCIFTELATLDRFSHRVAMSVYCSVFLRHRVQFFSRSLIGPQVTGLEQSEKYKGKRGFLATVCHLPKQKHFIYEQSWFAHIIRTICLVTSGFTLLSCPPPSEKYLVATLEELLSPAAWNIFNTGKCGWNNEQTGCATSGSTNILYGRASWCRVCNQRGLHYLVFQYWCFIIRND